MTIGKVKRSSSKKLLDEASKKNKRSKSHKGIEKHWSEKFADWDQSRRKVKKARRDSWDTMTPDKPARSSSKKHPNQK